MHLQRGWTPHSQSHTYTIPLHLASYSMHFERERKSALRIGMMHFNRPAHTSYPIYTNQHFVEGCVRWYTFALFPFKNAHFALSAVRDHCKKYITQMKCLLFSDYAIATGNLYTCSDTWSYIYIWLHIWYICIQIGMSRLDDAQKILCVSRNNALYTHNWLIKCADKRATV